MNSNKFETIYSSFVRIFLDRDLTIFDGVPEHEIFKVEINLGSKLSKSIKSYYQIVGRCDELNNYHNRIISIENIFVENGFLIFAEENQYVVYWGIKYESLSEIDPIVWQIQNEEPPEYYSEEKTFSEFLKEMFSWQFNNIKT